ncbi:MAG: ThuA domain-containing protein [Nitrospira sp.]|nr:ThuA domain-containing protein [Nitrospira sp.]
MMIPRLVACLAALLACLTAWAAGPTDVELNGTWRIASAEMNGDALPSESLTEFELTLKNGSYVLTGPNLSARGTFVVDPSKTPAAMDIREVEGPNAGKDFVAIVETTTTGMRICYALGGGARPASFKTAPDSGQFLAVYERKGGSSHDGARPIRALMISGGCCHDYEGQDRILSEGISKRARVDWTIVRDAGQTGTKHKISVYHKEDWAAGYDVVVHNECFSHEQDLDWLERIVKPHREGVPAVVIHCAMHCYRAPTNEWFRFVGVTSHGHGSHFAYPMTNVKPEHPIMKGFPAVWMTPMEELYNIASIEKTATPLATGYSPETKRGEANVWINTFGKARVFGTTVGHYNHTMQEKIFLDMVARGLLWAAAKLGDDGEPLPGYGPR